MGSDHNMRLSASLESNGLQTTLKGLVLVLMLVTGFFLVLAVASAFQLAVVQHLGAKDFVSVVLAGSTLFTSTYLVFFIPSLFLGALVLPARRTMILGIAFWLGLLTAAWFLAAGVFSHIETGVSVSVTSQVVSGVQSAIYVLIGLTVAYFAYMLRKAVIAKETELA
jgi:hypothetical protein